MFVKMIDVDENFILKGTQLCSPLNSFSFVVEKKKKEKNLVIGL